MRPCTQTRRSADPRWPSHHFKGPEDSQLVLTSANVSACAKLTPSLPAETLGRLTLPITILVEFACRHFQFFKSSHCCAEQWHRPGASSNLTRNQHAKETEKTSPPEYTALMRQHKHGKGAKHFDRMFRNAGQSSTSKSGLQFRTSWSTCAADKPQSVAMAVSNLMRACNRRGQSCQVHLRWDVSTHTESLEVDFPN